MTTETAPATEPKFLVRTDPESAHTPKFWTGKIIGRWPEYSRDREKAASCSERTAKQAAAQFSACRADSSAWVIEPAASA